MTHAQSPVLQVLGDHGRTIAAADTDVRGFRVVDRDGADVGKVEDLLVDEGELRVRLMRVSHGGVLGIGSTSSYIPVEAVTSVQQEVVHIDPTRAVVDGAPRYDPEVVDDPVHLAPLYTFYGYPPFWG